jgi:hypothetical protein
VFAIVILGLSVTLVFLGLGHPPTLLVTAVVAIPMFAGFALRRRAQQIKKAIEEAREK